jgi:acyl-CoA synthetase (AMP-forming)/AMP-acid ligase II
MSLVELLVRRAEAHPDKLACAIVGEAEWSYGELDVQARRMAAALRRRGARPGDRVLLIMPTSLELVAAFFGCLYAGAIAVPVNPPRSASRLGPLARVAENSGAAFAIVARALAPLIEPFAPGRVLVAEDEHALDSEPPADAGPETIAFLQYTSGSTSDPKGVVVSHGNVLHNQAMITASFGHDESMRTVSWLPLYHDMGLIGMLLNPLFIGGSVWFMDPLAFAQRPVRWLQAISKVRATSSGGPNFAFDLCCERISDAERDALDLSSWNVAFCGAEPIRGATLERFASTFASCGFRREAFLPCYGLAEATLFVTGRASGQGPSYLAVSAEALERGEVAPARDSDERKLVSCGRTWSDLEVSIVDPETKLPAAAGRVGEIWVSGKSVTRGYWNHAEATAETFGAHLRTGDLGFMHDGEVYVTGRSKDLLIVDGRNHYPQDIELTAQDSHPRLAARTGAAFVVAEDLVIVHECDVVSHEQEAEIAQAVRSAVSAHHDLHAHTIVLVASGTIPRTSSGKVRRAACRDQFEAGTLRIRRRANE